MSVLVVFGGFFFRSNNSTNNQKKRGLANGASGRVLSTNTGSYAKSYCM